MMTDPAMVMMASSAALAGLAMASAATLRAWSGWLELKRLELDGNRRSRSPAGGRVELTDLKERVRKLEAIASGIEI
jgi:hypothetical protein